MKFLDDRDATVSLDSGIDIGPGRIVEENNKYMWLYVQEDVVYPEREYQIPVDRVLYIRYIGRDSTRDYDDKSL